MPLDFSFTEEQNLLRDSVREFASRPLDFEPRSRYSYSNTGYLLLGQIAEQAGREPFAVFLGDDVIDAEVPAMKQMMAAFDRLTLDLLADLQIARPRHRYGHCIFIVIARTRSGIK